MAYPFSLIFLSMALSIIFISRFFSSIIPPSTKSLNSLEILSRVVPVRAARSTKLRGRLKVSLAKTLSLKYRMASANFPLLFFCWRLTNLSK